MPSRQPSPPPPPPPQPLIQPELTSKSTVTEHHRHRHHHHFPFIPITIAAAIVICILIFVAVLYRKLSRKRTAPADLKPPHRFSYSVLRRATSSFSGSNRLGQGGFGSVYRGTLQSGQEIAVKLMDSGSLQGEREFQNELSLAGKIDSDYIVSLIGFSSDQRRRRMLLVYELMHNRSLQDALLDRKCSELMEWKKRYSIAIDIARGLEFLHYSCDPVVIHGDIKPSNILLDFDFNAKIADFGLARSKIEENFEVVVGVSEIEDKKICNGIDKGKKKKKKKEEGSEEVTTGGGDDNGSIIEETESVMTGFEEVVVTNCCGGVEASPVKEAEASPETVVVEEASPSEIMDRTSVSDGNFDKLSMDSRKDLVSEGGNGLGGRKKSGTGKDWWWKQDNGGGSESGGVKDYVMEWIGTEIKKERPKSDWVTSLGDEVSKPIAKTEKKKQHRRLEWWASLDEDKVMKKEKNRPAREWWREEFCEELTKKKKKRELKSSSGGSGADSWWQKDEDSVSDRKKKKKKGWNKSSRGSVDWWLDGFSGEIRANRRSSRDWASGEIPKSGGVSSTPSMRGTVCYIAPEYGGGGQLSEKCDVYSYGVLLLVLISGRRPLQVTASPMSEFERANLISWARHLARSGKLQDLFDPAIQSLDREQALMCATVALLCLQRSPSRRPTIKEVVGMLSGESEPPHLPFEFSPSPPSSFPFKSRKKARLVAIVSNFTDGPSPRRVGISFIKWISTGFRLQLMCYNYKHLWDSLFTDKFQQAISSPSSTLNIKRNPRACRFGFPTKSADPRRCSGMFPRLMVYAASNSGPAI